MALVVRRDSLGAAAAMKPEPVPRQLLVAFTVLLDNVEGSSTPSKVMAQSRHTTRRAKGKDYGEDGLVGILAAGPCNA
jgi:hypothetical protein